MEETFFIKPIGDVCLVDPDTNLPLPAEGATVVRNVFWLRRVQDGSVAVVEQPKAAAKSKKED